MALLLIALLTIGAISYIACGVAAYGITFAYFQREYAAVADADWRGNAAFAAVMAIGGPAGLLTALVCSDGAKHGVQWRHRPQRGGLT